MLEHALSDRLLTAIDEELGRPERDPHGDPIPSADGTVAQPHAVLLRDVAEAMHQGRAITVAPVSLRLTTTQAADMLGVSRPTLIKLLEDGEIPYEQPRRHRLLRLDDVLAYRESRRRRRVAQLDELTRQAVADGLYEASADTYREALREARSGRH